ncbi:TetR/AcrR family transcriptional regulator [Pseudoflavitalea sp. G-6-1-2]|uniref:TetR/AcrR family transcriptional regulator n=1 Tax=Pseudoflavitalea sp. G-6-1-2 TaxID=2728841 RepID=UPI00146ECE0E|nr:TetR/AcrR family transcriptional regulator [Pseudoflavitalea sp. G-6-1-2]NML23527.1 TetR/AcrR family transcriptional regulator [Pseudoflavitalea sp. G-6-1-2]
MTKAGSTEITIREQAIHMIAKEGFDGFSMNKLAKVSGFSVAAIYIYYKNKEELLSRIFNYVQTDFSDHMLKGFAADASFEKGLWTLWENYVAFALAKPSYFLFFDLFRNSHLVNSADIEVSSFNQSVEKFARNAINKKEIRGMEPELFWSLAFGPLNALIRFHFEKENVYTHEMFEITKKNLKSLFSMVVAGFQRKK